MAKNDLGWLLVLAFAAGCSAGGFGGIGAKNKDGGASKPKSPEKSEAAGEDGDDDETEEADSPVEVAGAFLTVACAPTATTPSHLPEGDYKAFGCAVIDRSSRTFYADATLRNVVFSYAEGAEQVVPLVDAPKGGPWHSFTYVESAKAKVLKSIRGFAAVNEKDIETVNVDLKIYDPEGLVQTTEDEKKTVQDGIPLTVLATAPPTHGSRARATIDGAPNTAWNVPGSEEPHHVWVIYDLGRLHKLTAIDFDLCAAAPDSGVLHASKEVAHTTHGNLKDPDEIGEVAPGRFGAIHWQIDAEVKAARYVKIYLQEEGASNSVCLNSVRIHGEPLSTGP